MRFHLIDRVDRIVPNRSVTARKLTSHLETYWRDEGRGPEMPAPLILEALCQAGTWLVMTSSELRSRAALLAIEEVVFRGPVRPGDVLHLEGAVESIGGDTAVLSGRACVDGRAVLEARDLMCALVPTEELEDPESVRLMQQQLTRSRERAA